ncbi:MAG: hypothetical protein KDC38_00705 [Planctomycetes bacterium]|nr:hypothetical protein [Planctomycetota bacterium]
MAPPVVMQEYETRQLVFGAYDHLSYGNKIEAGEVQIDLSPRSWYWDHSSSKVVRDRWVYVFTSYQFRLNGSSTLLPQLRLLFEIYVDEEGKHWRTDERELIRETPGEIHLDAQFTDAQFREERMQKRRKESDASTTFTVLPLYVDGQKANHWVFISPFALPSKSINELQALVQEMPWAVAWDRKGTFHLNAAGTTTIEVEEDTGEATITREVEADIVLGVDPMAIAQGTNRLFRKSLERFREKYASESERVAFARELHSLLTNDFKLYQEVKSELLGEDLGLIESTIARVDYEKRDDVRKYEARVGALCAFLESDLWKATVRSHRLDDRSSDDSEHVVDLLYGFERVTEGLVESASGGRYLERVGRGLVYHGRTDFVSDYVFPSSKPASKTDLSNLSTALGAILPIYSRLFPTLEITEARFRHEALRKHLSVFADGEFEMIQRLPTVVKGGFFITTKLGPGPITGKWISKEDLAEIKQKVDRETRRRQANTKHGKIQTILKRVDFALHAINLGIAEADFHQALANGDVSLRAQADRTMARVSFSLTLATEYAEIVLGKKAAEKSLFVAGLAKAGAIPGIYFAIADIADGAKGFSSGNYAVGVGHVLNGFVGLAGALALLAGLTGIGLVGVVISLLGSVLIGAATKSEVEEFFHHCEWGKQHVGRNGKPNYSPKEFFRWGGDFDTQRDALHRILCQYSGRPRQTTQKEHDVELVLDIANYTPDTIIRIDWEAVLALGEKRKSQRVIRSKELRGKRTIVSDVRDIEKESRLSSLKATIHVDLHGDGSLVFPKKGLVVELMTAGLILSGTARSIDIGE